MKIKTILYTSHRRSKQIGGRYNIQISEYDKLTLTRLLGWVGLGGVIGYYFEKMFKYGKFVIKQTRIIFTKLIYSCKRDFLQVLKNKIK